MNERITCPVCNRSLYRMWKGQKYCSKDCYRLRPNRAIQELDRQEDERARQLSHELYQMRAEMIERGYPTMPDFRAAGVSYPDPV